MNDVDLQDQEALRKELRGAREKLEGLLRDVHAVDAELEDLAVERHRYRLLQDVCGALDELAELGAADLFWTGRLDRSVGEAHLRDVRGEIDEFEKRLVQIEMRRQDLVDEIHRQEDDADLIAGDLLEAERLEEARKQEWQIEREGAVIAIRPAMMPWARGGEDDRRFRKSLAASLLLSLLLGLLMPLVDLPVPDRWKPIEVPERLTSLIREEIPPPPPIALEEPKPVTPDETEPEPREEEPLVAEQRPSDTPASPAPKKDARSKGILAFKEKFSSLADDKAAGRLGSNARISNPGEVTSGMPERSMVTTRAIGSSGGINIASLSRDVGNGDGTQMGGVQVARATSSIGAGGGTDRPLAGGGPGLSRTDEEIQIVFDRHKAALYRLYNRELRKNPTLKGQMVLRLTIQPDGSVSLCELKSTDMKSTELTTQVIARVKTFDFGAKEGIPAVTIVYPIDFLPAT